MNGNISKTIAIVLASALLTAASAGCAGNNSGSASSAESTASAQSTVSLTESSTNGTSQTTSDTSQSAPQQSSQTSAQSSAESSEPISVPEPQTSPAGTVVVDPSFLGQMTQLTDDAVTGAYLGINESGSALTLVTLDDDTAVLLAGVMNGSGFTYDAAIFGSCKKLSDMDTYDDNGFGAVYSITNAAGQELTFSITGTKTGPGSENVSIRIDGLDTVYICQEAAAEEAVSTIKQHAQLYTGAAPTEQSSAPAPQYPAFFKELGTIQESEITFALAGETASGAELLYVEIADGTQNGKALVAAARGGLGNGAAGFDVTILGSCSNLAKSVTAGNSSASLTVTDSSGNSVEVSVSQADEPGMFYASISGYDDQFITEQMSAEDTIPILQAFAVAAGADPASFIDIDDDDDEDDDDDDNFDSDIENDDASDIDPIDIDDD